MNFHLNNYLKWLLIYFGFFLLSYYVWLYFLPSSNLIKGASAIMDGIAAISLWYTAFRSRSKKKMRSFWLLLFFGCISFVLADITWLYEAMLLQPNLPSIVNVSDIFYILFYVFYLLAFSTKITYEYNLQQKLLIFCDIGSTFIAAVTLTYNLVIDKIIHEQAAPQLIKWIELIYPFSDILLLLICISLYFQRHKFVSRRVLNLLVVSTVLFTLADTLNSIFYLEENRFLINLFNPLYQLSLILIAIAGVYDSRTSEWEQKTMETTKEKNIELSLSYISTICLAIFTVITPRTSTYTEVSLSLCLLLFLFRQFLVNSENKNLLAQLMQFNTKLEKRVKEATQDILDQKEALQQSKEKFKSLYEFHPDPIFTLDRNGNFQQVNKAGITLLGYQASEILGKPFHFLISSRDVKKSQDVFRSVLKGSSISTEVRSTHKNGHTYFLNMTCIPFYEGNTITGIYIMIKDITESKMQQTQISYLAYHDTLTNLANRRAFTDDLEKSIKRIKKQGGTLALTFIDLDRFKVINDTLGHNTGDLVLSETARRLERVSDSFGSSLYRLSGDEFIIIIEGYSDSNKLKEMATTLLQAMHEPIQISHHSLHITLSIGIAVYKEDCNDATSLLAHADMALYNSKRQGKNSFSIYDTTLDDKMKRQLSIEKDLYNALENSELFLVYQPQVDISLNQMIGVEALIRWRHPQYGLISPSEFIPIAEETDLIIDIGKWVLEEACRKMKMWHDVGWNEGKVGVNLSARQFKQENFIQIVTNVLQKTGLPAQYLDLELTERVAMANEKETLEKLRKLKELGILISIDDFGTGYSTLAYLSLYPLDALKIPYEFTSMSVESIEGKEIISTILSLARTLGISVIAEGVETKEQLEFLASHDCNIIQGYYFSPPMHERNITLFFERNTTQQALSF